VKGRKKERQEGRKRGVKEGRKDIKEGIQEGRKMKEGRRRKEDEGRKEGTKAGRNVLFGRDRERDPIGQDDFKHGQFLHLRQRHGHLLVRV
jgi:hypothetical protein